MSQEILRALTRGAYDIQKLRIQVGLRLVANFRSKIGMLTSIESEDDIDLEVAITDGNDHPGKVSDAKLAKTLIASLRKEYVLLSTGVARNRTLPERMGFAGGSIISAWSELVLVDQYIQLEKAEKNAFVQIGKELEAVPIWNTWLKNQRGIGATLGAVIVTSFDIHKSPYVSNLWSYAGLSVGPDGAAISRRSEHLVDRKYTRSDGVEDTRKSTTFNPWLQSKLIAVAGTSFLRANSPYRKFYDDYKHRIVTDPNRRKMSDAQKSKLRLAGEDVRDCWPPGRIHSAAIRYMLKMFLIDLYKEWRTIENLPIAPSYVESQRGYAHGKFGESA